MTGGKTPRLPGMSKQTRPRRGPQRRRAEQAVRGLDRTGNVDVAIGLLYYTADMLDAMVDDPDASPFNMSRTVAEHRMTAQWLGALTATTSADVDPFAELLEALHADDTPGST